MRVKFFGATQTVTGSMHLLEIEKGPTILLDCGLYQGEEFASENINSEFPCSPKDVDILVLSHAHIDHCGNIPQFVKKGFKGKIFSTHATYDLATIMLADSAAIQEKDTAFDNKWRARKQMPLLTPLYRPEDVGPALDLFFSIPYNTWHPIASGVDLLFRDAGHMLGSASVTLKINEGGKEIVFGFTGDVGRINKPILRDPQPMPEVDYLISESTYGGKDHDDFAIAEEELLKIIEEACVRKKGKLMIPAFSVGRTQDIVHTLDRLENQGRLPSIPVFVDSPLSVNATQIFELHPECFDDELKKYMLKDPNPFGFSKLKYTREVADSKAINNQKGPMIIIASSGMANAGRILHHFVNNIEDPANTILIVGYCAQGTLGAALVNGVNKVKIYGDVYKVKADVKRMSAYSAHAGQSELATFLSNQKSGKLKKMWLVHGEPDRCIAMKNYLESEAFHNISIPSRGDQFEI